MDLDSYGHGTAMAGIIAGREVAKGSGASYAADNTNFYGMAPDARIISLKLADRSGAVDVSQMIAAVDWVTTNRKRNGLNIRVLNLSYGTNTSLSWQDDPLSWAAEAAWHEGVVVVASAGNDGATKIGLASPAFNPWLLAVGSSDQKGTPTVADDVVAGFSEVGGGRTRGPDLVAPGMSIVAPGVKGSYIASTYPNAVIGNTFVRGSGTSQSAAVVSGAVALTLQKFPDLTPDEVKRFLMRTAFTIPNVASDSQGKGMVSLAKVLNETPDYGYKQSSVISRGNGGGSINASRNGSYVTVGGSAITGEVDIMGQAWNSAAMATAADTDKAWTSDGQFNGNYWTGAGLANDTTSWAGRTWLGRTWLGRTWLGRTWLGRTWLSASWTGSGWSSATWSSPVGVPSWAGAVWSTNGWG
jgi:serine protease AprX